MAPFTTLGDPYGTRESIGKYVVHPCFWEFYVIELMINKFHGLSPSGGLVSPSGGFALLLFDQVEHFASIKLCLALSRQGAEIKIPVVRCHYLLCSARQFSQFSLNKRQDNMCSDRIFHQKLSKFYFQRSRRLKVQCNNSKNSRVTESKIVCF